MKKSYSLLLSLLAVLVICFTSCSDDNADYNRDYIQLNLNSFDLSNGLETSGGKYWKDTYNTSPVNVSSQIFRFSHTATKWVSETLFWDGFTVSNSNQNTDQSLSGWLPNQWSAMPKGGVDGVGEAFVVAYGSGLKYGSKIIAPFEGKIFEEADFTNWIKIDDSGTYTAVSVMITNSSWTYYSILNGDGFARRFEAGDYFILKAYGVGADMKISNSVDFYLADYRSGKSDIVTSWKRFDLSALGEVRYIIFSLESTDKNDYGIKTTAYYCLDKLTVAKVS